MGNRTIYGPVPSRRLGYSLGIDPIPYKTCSFDCIYCQLGRTTKKTIRRREYIPTSKVIGELEEILARESTIDYITFSGSGEPTLNSQIGRMIRAVKYITSIPVAVITNGSLLTLRSVREELRIADLVIPSLDAGREQTFQKINRPHARISLKNVIDGLIQFRDVYPGRIHLEIMLVRDVNDTEEEIDRIKELTEDLKPDLIELNTVYRPPQEIAVRPVSKRRLTQIRQKLGAKCKIVAPFRRRGRAYREDINELIREILKRRPATIEDIAKTSGLNPSMVIKYIDQLIKLGEIRIVRFRSTRYYAID